MDTTKLSRMTHKAYKYIDKNSATILSALSVAGVVSTAVMAVKATPKAIDILNEKEEHKQEIYNTSLTPFEKAIAIAPAYLPSILMGTATITCILGANHISKEKEAMLLSAYSYLNANFNEYKEKVKEIYGEEGELKVREEIAKDKYEPRVIDNTEVKTFYDEYSQRYFEMSIADMHEVLYKINRDYNFTGEMSLNQFYEYFNLPPVGFGSVLGWSAFKDAECVGYSWIEVTWEPMEMPDGMECYVLKFNIDPSEDFYNWSW